MSRANLYVRLPSGEVRYGIYNGTCDIAQPNLYDTPDQAWEAWRSHTTWGEYDEGAGDPVVVATDYGGGWAWEATATRDRLTSKHEMYPYDGDSPAELPFPEWAKYPEATR